MNNTDMMQNQTMMKDMMLQEMQKHHSIMYTFDVLVLIGLAAIIVLLVKILKAHKS